MTTASAWTEVQTAVGGALRLAVGDRRGLKFFDTSKFTFNQVGAFGNTGRNILRGPRYFNTDLGILKVTSVTERIGLQFRAEAFNVLNNVNFQMPNANVSAAQFGQITAVIDDSQRIVQFGLKVVF